MGYRLPEYWYHASDVSPHIRIAIDNGIVSRIAIPCFYRYFDGMTTTHDRMMHDHIGWPSPGHPDASCQEHDGCGHLVIRDIDLEEEGYDSIEADMVDGPEGLTISGEIDGSVIRLTIKSLCQEAIEESIDVPFSIYAVSDDDTMRDVVIKGVLHIVAGPIA